MTNTRLSLLLVSFALQTSCFSYTPPQSYQVPVPDPSTYVTLNCEEMAYKKNGYQQLLQNVATDHPTDAYQYTPSYQAQIQGLTNASAQRGCSVEANASNALSQSPKSSSSMAVQASSSTSSCLAWYSRRSLMEPANTSTGVVTKPWIAGPISSSPARTALAEFQSYMVSQGTNDQLGPISCNTTADLQSCSATRAEDGNFSHGSFLATVSCAPTPTGAEKAQSYITTTYPLTQVIDWRPVASTAATDGVEQSAPTKPQTPSTSAPAPLTTSTNPARESTVADLMAKETVEKYQNRSCDYLHLSLTDADKLSVSPIPQVQQLGHLQKSVISQVFQQRKCPPLSPLTGRIGATVVTVDPVKAPRLKIPGAGASVENTSPGSKAEQAGLTRGDVVVAVNDSPIADTIDFRLAIGQSAVNSTVRLKIWRVRQFIDVPVQIGQ